MGYNLTAEQQDELKMLKEKKERGDILALEKERLGALLELEKRLREATEKVEAKEAEEGVKLLEESIDRGESLDDFRKEHPEYFNKMR